MDDFLLILNPRAAGGRALQYRSAIERVFRDRGLDFITRLTESPGHATELTREALRAGRSGVAAVGGDGSFNEVANGFLDEAGEPMRSQAWFAPLPCGTGGDFRRSLGLPTNVIQAAARMIDTEPTSHDLGRLRFVGNDGEPAHRAFINIASFGMAGEIDLLVNDGPKWMGGRLSFYWGTLRAMRSFTPPTVRLTVDDNPTTTLQMTNIAVANGRYFGGGMQIAPPAQTNDGELDVVTVGALSVVEQLLLTPRIYGAGVLDHPEVNHQRGRRIFAEPVDPEVRVILDVDGETPGILPAEFEVLPGAIQIRG